MSEFRRGRSPDDLPLFNGGGNGKAEEKPGRSRPPRTLEEARRDFRDNLGDGMVCPCCDRWGKAYRRRLNETMVRTLAWIISLSGRDRGWVDVPESARKLRGSYDFTKQYSTLKHWDFLDHKPNEEDPSKKESGIWRPTRRAVRFIRGKIEVPKYVVTYNDDRLTYDGPLVSVGEIIGGFDYRQVMESIRDWQAAQ